MARGSTSATVIDGVANAVDPFIAATLSNLEAGALARDDSTTTHARLFVCGAVMYLADYDGIDKTSADELVMAKLRKHFALDTADANAMITVLDEISPRDSAHIFLVEGASAMRQWVANNDDNAFFKLKELTN